VIDRRTFVREVVLGLLTPLIANAQGPGKSHRVGILHMGSARNTYDEAFRTGLHELGYRENHNLMLEYRWAEGRPERLPALAAELVQLPVEVIFTGSTPGALAAKRATATVPIVFVAVGDPVGAGVVSNLARPDGNITGLTHFSVDLAGKTLALLKEAVSDLARVAVFAPSLNPTTALKLHGIEAAAHALGVRLQLVEVQGSSDFEAAFAAIRREKPDALMVLLDTLTVTRAQEIADFALTNRLPAIYELRDFVDAGGLMSYSTDFLQMFRRAATYVDKILRGVKLAELPVEQPMKFELVINLKTAKALNLTIPPMLLFQADEVIR
jgi:putative ABC transport system substrate-binding protein